MGSGFFDKVASVDPLAQALHLPGSDKYRQQQANDANSKGAVGPYAGVTPTLAGANAGYAPGGPGSNPDWKPFVAQAPGGLFGFAQRFSSSVGDTTPSPDKALSGKVALPSSPGQIANTYSTGTPTGMQDPYGAPAYVAASKQAGMNPANTTASTNALFRRPVTRGTQPVVGQWG